MPVPTVVQLADQFMFVYDASTSASTSASNRYTPQSYNVGKTTILVPLLSVSASLTSNISVYANNSRTHSDHRFEVNRPMVWDNQTHPGQSPATAFNVAISAAFANLWIDITKDCTIGNGYIIVNNPYRHIRLQGTAVKSLDSPGSVSAGYVWGDTCVNPQEVSFA